jgi:hypothetical protein
MYELTSTNRQRSMAWDSSAVDGPPDRTFRHGGGIQRAWVLPGIGSIRPSLPTWQHRDSSWPQNLCRSRHYWFCVQLLILEDLQWLGWGLCVERVPFMLRSGTRVSFVYELRLE